MSHCYDFLCEGALDVKWDQLIGQNPQLHAKFVNTVCHSSASYLIICHVRVSSKANFGWKQPKLERKLVSTLFKTRCFFRLLRFNIETERFGV
jgi:hypothetical protein